ncbi:24546_t:CDS:2, partial [Gigaspora rosea]
MIYDIINDQPVINYSYIKEDLPVSDIRFFSETIFVMSCSFETSYKSFNFQKCLESQNSSVIHDSNCNKYINAPLEKDGTFYNGYFSIPFENNYKLVLSNNTKHGNHEIVNSEMNISPIFLQSIAQANTYKILTQQSIDIYLSRRIRKFIIPNWKTTMGFQPDYIIKPYPTSRKRVTQPLTQFRVQLLDSSKNIDYDDESRVDQLEKQINDLELFLRNYAVDAQQLDKAYINNEHDKDIY